MSSLSAVVYNSHDRAVLARYVTNMDGNVYCITNLPEEVVAVIFAYVSRSPKSFRENLLQLLRDGDLGVNEPEYSQSAVGQATQRAAAFHERWVVGYGHSSVAEHAVAHIGIEGISRLASAALELANPFLSFTEYSQRYQKPQRGAFVVPANLPSPLAHRYIKVMDALYDAYETLYQGLLYHHLNTAPPVAGETADARQGRLAKVAFEDARYVLPLATSTSLGLTGNGRALRDCLVELRAASLPECRDLANAIAAEVTKVLPTLLRHATPTAYQEAQTALQEVIHQQQARRAVPNSSPAGADVKLLAFTGQHTADPERSAMDLLQAVFAAAPEAPDTATDYSDKLLAGLGPHDALPLACHWVRYDCQLVLSEAAWHQLLRHMRGMAFQWGPPEISNGYTIPPHVADAGLAENLAEAVRLAEALYADMYQVSPVLAGYAVTNAHRRRVRAELDLRQLYHLANLRMSDHAQWDIRNAVTKLWAEVARVHPRLVAAASRRE